MFAWFFNSPKEKELKDFNWLKEQLEKTPASQEELKEILSEIEAVVKELNRKKGS